MKLSSGTSVRTAGKVYLSPALAGHLTASPHCVMKWGRFGTTFTVHPWYFTNAPESHGRAEVPYTMRFIYKPASADLPAWPYTCYREASEIEHFEWVTGEPSNAHCVSSKSIDIRRTSESFASASADNTE